MWLLSPSLSAPLGTGSQADLTAAPQSLSSFAVCASSGLGWGCYHHCNESPPTKEPPAKGLGAGAGSAEAVMERETEPGASQPSCAGLSVRDAQESSVRRALSPLEPRALSAEPRPTGPPTPSPAGFSPARRDGSRGPRGSAESTNPESGTGPCHQLAVPGRSQPRVTATTPGLLCPEPGGPGSKPAAGRSEGTSAYAAARGRPGLHPLPRP